MAVVGLSVATVLIGRERDEARRQRQQARKAVDDNYTRVAETWLADRLDPLQREFLEKALAYYRDFAGPDEGDPGLRQDRGRAYLRMGDVLRKLGRHDEAEPAYRQSIAILGEAGQRPADQRPSTATTWPRRPSGSARSGPPGTRRPSSTRPPGSTARPPRPRRPWWPTSRRRPGGSPWGGPWRPGRPPPRDRPGRPTPRRPTGGPSPLLEKAVGRRTRRGRPEAGTGREPRRPGDPAQGTRAARRGEGDRSAVGRGLREARRRGPDPPRALATAWPRPTTTSPWCSARPGPLRASPSRSSTRKSPSTGGSPRTTRPVPNIAGPWPGP